MGSKIREDYALVEKDKRVKITERPSYERNRIIDEGKLKVDRY